MDTNFRPGSSDVRPGSSDVRPKSPGDKQRFLREKKGILETTLESQKEQLQKFDQLHRGWKEERENLFIAEKTIVDLETSITSLEEEKRKIGILNGIIKTVIEIFKEKKVNDQYEILNRNGWIDIFKGAGPAFLDLLHKAKDNTSDQTLFLFHNEKPIDYFRQRYQDTTLPQDIQSVQALTAKFIKFGIECKEIDFNSIAHFTNRIPNRDSCIKLMTTLLERLKNEKSEKYDINVKLLEIQSWLQESTFSKKYIIPHMYVKVLEKIESLLNRAVTVNQSSDQLGQLQEDLKSFNDDITQSSTLQSYDTRWSDSISTLCTSASRETTQELHSKITQKIKALEAKVSTMEEGTDEHRHTQKAIEFLTTVESTETGASSADNLAYIKSQFRAAVIYCMTNKIKNQDFDGYQEIADLHQRLNLEEQLRKDHRTYQQDLADWRNKADTDGKEVTSADKEEFVTNITEYLEIHLSLLKHQAETYSQLSAVIDFCDSIHQKLPESLEALLSENDRKIKEIEDNIDRDTQLLDEARSNKESTQEQIDQYERSIKADYGEEVSGDMSSEDIDNRLNSRRTQLEEEIRSTTDELAEITQELTNSEKAQDANTKKDTSLPDSRLLFESSSENTSLDIKNLLVDKNIAYYTNRIRKEYFKKHGEEVNIEIAVRSAQFLQSLVKDRRKYIRIAADLIHKFGVGLDSFHMNTETLKVEIVDPNTKGDNLVQLRLNRYGDLVTADGKKLKCSVIASQEEDPYKCILSIRSPKLNFAPETPMQQSGSANLEDLGGDMNLLYYTVQREFREEAPGYEIAEKTLHPTNYQETGDERILHFRASIEKYPSKEADNKPRKFAETTDTWVLDVRDLLETLPPLKTSISSDSGNNAFMQYDFTNKAHRLAVKKFILEKAAQTGVISRSAKDRGQRSKDYLQSSYNVDHLVDYIGECATKLASERKQEAQNIYWRLIGKEEWQHHRTS